MNKYFTVLIASVIVIGFFIVVKNTINEKEISDNFNSSRDICSQIRGIPAFIYNNSIFYGEKDINVDSLIYGNVTFVYDNDCSHCNSQKLFWGKSDWERYQETNLTVECDLI